MSLRIFTLTVAALRPNFAWSRSRSRAISATLRVNLGTVLRLVRERQPELLRAWHDFFGTS